MELEQSFIALIEQSIKTNWYLNALTDYKGITLQYRDVARKIEKIHILLENAGIEKGDKIAICGRKSTLERREHCRFHHRSCHRLYQTA